MNFYGKNGFGLQQKGRLLLRVQKGEACRAGAGGCFRGMEGWIRKLGGVTSTVAGYTGGNVPNTTCRNHSTHAGAMATAVDPEILFCRKLMKFFLRIRNPITKNRQGNDTGLSHWPAIFYFTEEKKKHGTGPGPDFWEAGEEHQAYCKISLWPYLSLHSAPNGNWRKSVQHSRFSLPCYLSCSFMRLWVIIPYLCAGFTNYSVCMLIIK